MPAGVPPDYQTGAVLPSIPGLRFRHFAGPADYPAMNDVANDAREANGVPMASDVERFAHYYAHLDPEHCDLSRDLFLVEVGDRLAGYGRCDWQDEADSRTHYLTCFLRPGHRRQGIGRAMLETLEERAIASLAEHPTDLPASFGADTLGDPGADALLTRAGYVASRWFHVMVRPNLDPVADAPMPDGLEVRPVRPEHLRQIWDAGNESARELWGYSEPTEMDYERWLTDPVESDHTLWRVAWDGDQVAGQVRSFINSDLNERTGRKRGWVENILVRAPYRRRGLARALIKSSIDGLRERGMTEGALGVDTDNPTGALRLYESVGFRIESTETVYRKPMPAPA
jgi:GNAT superfamily N-acetyltransferase